MRLSRTSTDGAMYWKAGYDYAQSLFLRVSFAQGFFTLIIFTALLLRYLAS